jgi:hypothetical protein
MTLCRTLKVKRFLLPSEVLNLVRNQRVAQVLSTDLTNGSCFKSFIMTNFPILSKKKAVFEVHEIELFLCDMKSRRFGLILL